MPIKPKETVRVQVRNIAYEAESIPAPMQWQPVASRQKSPSPFMPLNQQKPALSKSQEFIRSVAQGFKSVVGTIKQAVDVPQQMAQRMNVVTFCFHCIDKMHK